MSIIKQVQPTKIFMGKLQYGCDLLEEITNICSAYDIRLGRVEGLGAVQKARLGFYNQRNREYQFRIFDQPLEITKLIGNISMKDNTPIVHAHITLAAEDSKAYGGHLAPGTIIFACEFIVQALEGPDFVRGFDEETGLPLWVM
ncbi:MAG: PPC domain-containing DNA-binding protein [bacterium]